MDGIDQKTMLNSKGNGETTGRTVEVTKEIASNKLEGMLGADAYAEFPTSITMAYETYSNRVDGLSNTLGNRDQVKG